MNKKKKKLMGGGILHDIIVALSSINKIVIDIFFWIFVIIFIAFVYVLFVEFTIKALIFAIFFAGMACLSFFAYFYEEDG